MIEQPKSFLHTIPNVTGKIGELQASVDKPALVCALKMLLQQRAEEPAICLAGNVTKKSNRWADRNNVPARPDMFVSLHK